MNEILLRNGNAASVDGSSAAGRITVEVDEHDPDRIIITSETNALQTNFATTTWLSVDDAVALREMLDRAIRQCRG